MLEEFSNAYSYAYDVGLALLTYVKEKFNIDKEEFIAHLLKSCDYFSLAEILKDL